MQRIRDKVTLGVVAGLGGCAIALPLDYALARLGLSHTPWIERSTGVTVSSRSDGKPEARVLGTLASLAIGSVCSIGQVYMHSATGRDSRLLKAVGYGFMTWMGVHGMGSRVTRTFGPDDSPAKASALSLMTNVLHSLISSEIIMRLADDSIYPEPSRAVADAATDTTRSRTSRPGPSLGLATT